MMANAASTQRLARSSRSPGLMFPLVNIAAASSTRLTMMSAVKGGCAKKAANPPSPRIARPKKDQAREERDQQQLPISRHRVVFRCYITCGVARAPIPGSPVHAKAHALVRLGGIAGAADEIE